VKIGVLLPMAASDAARVLSFARTAQDLGFDGVFAFDHFFPPGAPSDRPSLEAYTTLAAVAASTSRVRIGTLVTRASLRPAGLLAKQAASLDGIAGGRFVLGIGTGDALSRAEHDAFGLPYLGPDVRRDHLIETVRALKALFAGRRWPGGEHVPTVEGPLLPGPVTAGGPPVWLGGTSEGAVRAAAAWGDGWNGWALPLERFERRARLLRESAGARRVEATWGGAVVVGEDADQVGALLAARAERGISADVWAGDAGSFASWLERLAAAGATWAIVLPAGARDRLELIGERVLPLLRDRA
jgi:alkanesulfonate monooxygenase SsuD/methylene tetrahydromethanopterin reductase-like flavin-dependent oxidoreductase (luciferase family)